MTPQIWPQQKKNCPEPRGWDSLQPELIQRIASFLPANGVACCLRPLCHSTASALDGPQHKTVLLSKWAPQHAYAARWGAPGAMRSLTRKRREDLVRLTLASGSVHNLELAVACTGCPLTYGMANAAAGAGQLDVLRWLQGRGCRWLLTAGVMGAAAASGHLHVCAWLRDQGCSFGDYFVGPLTSAAAAGRQDVCAWLLANGCPWSGRALSAAAEAGHVALMDWLQQQWSAALVGQALSDLVPLADLVRSAARGCSLLVLQRLHREWAEGPGGWLERMQQEGEEERRGGLASITAAAASSIAPDWAAKVTWLQEERGYPLTSWACDEVTQCCRSDEEALARLTWLRGRGCEAATSRALRYAAHRGHTASLQYLLEGGLVHGGYLGGSGDVAPAAAAYGHLACLQVLHTAGVDMNPIDSLLDAACGGHLPVVRWLVETPGLEVPLSAKVAAEAAQSGSLELLSYLHERGCPWDVETWKKAVEWGSEEMQEWLREHGCPMQ